MIRKELEHLAISIDEIHTHPSNVRQGDVGAICESLKAHGQYRPIVFQQSTKRILAGNHTWKAAKALGWQQIAATPIICDDQQALRILLADNKANDLATYDEPELIELLKQLADTDEGLLGTLFDEDELDSLIADQSHFELPTDVDDVPENIPAVSKLGDVWLLGEHRLMCGDSTSVDDVNKLLLGELVEMVYTDPPYGVDYEGGATKRKKIEGDETTDLFEPATKIAYQVSTNNAPLYLWHAAGKFTSQVDSAVTKAGYEIRAQIVWNKNTAQFGAFSAHYHQKHEPCYYCVKKGGTASWSGTTTEVTVWDEERSSKNEYHPTQKPVGLAIRAMNNHTAKTVLDLFGGSGSTLIAAQETNRVAYLMELDPHYVDVICARYQKHTGNQPILEATGETHNFTPDAD